MDAQETDLRAYLRGQGLLVARRGDTLAITVPTDKLFEKGRISTWGNALLQTLAQVMAHYDHTLIDINAYTDARSGEEKDQSRSQKRAEAVAGGLEHNGIAASRIKASGLGVTHLRVTNPNDPRNRRVEIKITPNPK